MIIEEDEEEDDTNKKSSPNLKEDKIEDIVK
jgi:hypothetical protein